MVLLKEKSEELSNRLIDSSSLPLRVKWGLVSTMSDSFLECHGEESLGRILRVFESHYSSRLPFELSFFPIELTLRSLSTASFWGVLITFESKSIRHQLEREDWYDLVKREFSTLRPVPHLTLSSFFREACFSACYFALCSSQEKLSVKEQSSHKRKLAESFCSYLHHKQTTVFSSCGEESFVKQLLYSLIREVDPDDAFPEVMTAFDRQKGMLMVYRVGMAWVVKEGTLPGELFNTINGGFPLSCRLEKLLARVSKEKGCAVGMLDFLVELTPKEYQCGEGQSDIERGYHYVKKRLQSILGEYRDYTGTINTFRLNCYRAFSSAVETSPSFREKAVNASFTKEFFYSIVSVDHFAALQKEMVSLYLIYQYLMQQSISSFDSYLQLIEELPNALAVGVVSRDPSFKRLLQDKLTPLFDDDGFLPCYVALDHSHYSFFGIIVIDKALFPAVKSAISEGLQIWQERERKKQVLRLNCSNLPEAIVPAKASGGHEYLLQHLLFEGLMQFDLEGNVKKALAEKIEISEDHTHYQFTLREAYWSNGKRITAEDFVLSWKQTLETTPPYSDLETMEAIENVALFREKKVEFEAVGVRALDTFLLEVQLEHPVPYFLQLLAIPLYFVIPQDEGKRDPLWYYDKQGVSSGPFQLENSISDPELRLVKNPHYWNASAISLEAVVISKERDSKKIFDRFVRGDLHSIGVTTSLEAPPALLRQHASSCPFLNPLLYRYHINVMQFPLNSVKIRQALAWSLDREELIAPFSEEYQLTPAFSPVPHLALEKPTFFSRKEVQQLWKEGLAELEHSASSLIILKIGYNERNQLSQLLAKQIKNQWEKYFALRVELYPLNLGQFYHSTTSGFSCIVQAYFSSIKHPLPTLNEYNDQSHYFNLSKWTHTLYKEIVLRAYQEKNAKSCQHLCKQAAKMLMKEAAVIPLCDYWNPYFMSAQLKNVNLFQLGMSLRFASIEKREQIK